MNAWIPWKIALKEMKVIRRKKSIMGYIVALPILLSIVFSLIVKNQIVSSSNGISSQYQLGLEALTYIFVVMAAVLPSSIAAYSIVGEKVEKSLEPLLATPTSDIEILLGKGVASFLPPMISIWVGATIFMFATDSLTYNLLSFYYFPNWSAGIMLFLLAPLASIFGIEVSVILSSRVTDIRGANQLAGLMWIPFMGIFIAGVDGIIDFGVGSLLVISVIVLIIDLGLFFLSKATFNREEILTKWK